MGQVLLNTQDSVLMRKIIFLGRTTTGYWNSVDTKLKRDSSSCPCNNLIIKEMQILLKIYKIASLSLL